MSGPIVKAVMAYETQMLETDDLAWPFRDFMQWFDKFDCVEDPMWGAFFHGRSDCISYHEAADSVVTTWDYLAGRIDYKQAGIPF